MTGLVFDNLEVAYRIRGHEAAVLKSLSLQIGPGEAFGLVGESGSGKSTAALAAVRYLPRNGRVTGGRVLIGGRDLMALDPRELRELRARHIAMVYQDPGRALTPGLTIGRQLLEAFEAAAGLKGPAALEQAGAMLSRVQIGNPGRVMEQYPHEVSGGMQQRVVIAMALAKNPTVLILDEPTTGLDATVEADVLDLLAGLRAQTTMSILFISHSLAVIARVCNRVGVLYAGELVEEGPTADIFERPRHPYTADLLNCAPRAGHRKADGPLATIGGFPPALGSIASGCIFAARCSSATDLCREQRPPRIATRQDASSRCHYPERAARTSAVGSDAPRAQAPIRLDAPPVLRAHRLSKTFTVGGRALRVVHDIDLELWQGETLGLVGESGSGKTTLASMLLGLAAPDPESRIEFNGEVLRARATQRSRLQLKALQMVFQNPGAALNRSHTVRRLIGRALDLTGIRGSARQARLRELAAAVRLTDRQLDAKPGALSGGLKQRVAIARAFAGAPAVVVCDEPTSALDVSVQAAILNLLVELQIQQTIGYIFISHDLNVVYYLADRIAVLYLGRLMQVGPSAAVFDGPHHPYTAALLSANPSRADARAERTRLRGEIPNAAAMPPGCAFQTRCPRKIGPICETVEPSLLDAGERHFIRCHIPAAQLLAQPK